MSIDPIQPLFEDFAAAFLGGAQSEEVTLDVTVPSQDQTNWCWIAVALGIARAYHDNPPNQCTLATRVLGQGLLCCPSGGEPRCNVPHTLEEPLGANLAAKNSDATVKTFDFVRQEIGQGRPIAVRLASNQNAQAGHFVVIAGYRQVGNKVTLHIQDPYSGPQQIAFEEFLDNHQQAMSWEASYTTRGVNRSRVPKR